MPRYSTVNRERAGFQNGNPCQIEILGIILTVMSAKSLVFLILTGVQMCSAVTEDAPLHWIPLPSPQVQINGLPWYSQNGGELFRLPAKLKDTYRKAVWELAKSPSGGRIRFRTNSPVVAIRLEYPGPPEMEPNMHAYGQTGVDLYADGVFRGTAIAGLDAKPGKSSEHTYFKDQPRIDCKITLYLPLYTPAKVLGIGLDADAHVQPARPFAASNPVVFYGTSITQGGSASRPGMSYQAILGRVLNLDFVNLGFSGNGVGEPELARAVASINASCFVLDFAQNNPSVESLTQAYGPFLEVIRDAHPETPILVITPIYTAHESWSRDARVEGMRELIRQVAARRIATGDRHLGIVEGTDLLGPSRGDGLVDGTHPNDPGFQWMAEGLADRVAKVLGLKAER